MQIIKQYTEAGDEDVALFINSIARDIFLANKAKGFWEVPKEIADLNRVWNEPHHTDEEIQTAIAATTAKFSQRNVGELLALIHSELSEGLEAHRKNLNDDKLPHRKGLEVELADALIRILDMAAGLEMDIGGALIEKLAYNAGRPHKHGKEYCMPIRLTPNNVRD